jgi:hypothetical protein
MTSTAVNERRCDVVVRVSLSQTSSQYGSQAVDGRDEMCLLKFFLINA